MVNRYCHCCRNCYIFILAFYWSALAFAVERMVTVVVICCPHALGLAVPLVVAKSTALSAKHGLLIKNRTSFEIQEKSQHLFLIKQVH